MAACASPHVRNELLGGGADGGRHRRFVVSLFRHHAPLGAVLQLLIEGTFYFAAVILAVELNSRALVEATQSAMLPALVFAVLMVLVHIAVGLYHRNGALHLRGMVGKVLLSDGHRGSDGLRSILRSS